NASIETVDGSAGSVLLHQPEKDSLLFCYVVGESSEITQRLRGREMPTDEGIAGSVFQSGEGMITQDAQADVRHYREIDLATHYETKNMVTVPLKTTQGRTIGVMQILNLRTGSFDGRDLEALEILCGQAASAIETATLHRQVLDAEREQKRFSCEILLCVTQGKLRLVDPDEMPMEGSLALELAVEDGSDYARLRSELRQIAERAGMRSEAVDDMVLLVGEVITNSIKHAGGGRCVVAVTPERLVARVSDHGGGIRPEHLPAALLTPGFSTKVSLGMGFTLILELADRVWLSTGPRGTIVQVEKQLGPTPPDADPMEAVLERFAFQDGALPGDGQTAGTPA
ncbi:MAG TPA: ATP-binding protein, partial [Armatimonadota bacterium]|nr:ATP-binding protein [Armatimonadota bacterium]